MVIGPGRALLTKLSECEGHALQSLMDVFYGAGEAQSQVTFTLLSEGGARQHRYSRLV